MRKPYPSEEQDRFMVRLPDGMRELVSQAATKNKRTMNAEIVARLERSFQEEGDNRMNDFAHRITLLEEQVGKVRVLDSTLHLLQLRITDLEKNLPTK